MPIFNLAQFASMATTFAGGRLDWSLSEVSQYVNIAVSDLANRVGHTPLEAIAVSSTTSGVKRYQLPTDFDRAVALTMYVGSNSTATSSNQTETIVLRQMDARWIDAQDLEDTGNAGKPEAYLQYATWFSLFPSPSSAYSLQLRYFAKPGTLIASTDTPALDERWHAAVMFRTVELLEGSRGNIEGEALARNRYLNAVAGMPTDRARKQQDRIGMTLRFGRNKAKPD